MEQQETIQKIQTIVSRSNETYRWNLISKYAIAQSEIGIKLTCEIKDKIIGTTPLDDAPVEKLERLINKLRKEYVKLHPKR